MKRTYGYIRANHFALLLIMCGLIGLAASFMLTIDTMELLANPNTKLNCNINPIISCGSVMKTPEASLFGFTNSLLGLPAFSIILAMGVGTLAGITFRRWMWLGLLGGTASGMVLVHWLFYQSVYHIQALCPYCMAVWIVTMLIFLYTFRYVMAHHYSGRFQRSVHIFLSQHHGDIFVFWVLLIGGLILRHFWYYFKTVF